MGSTAECEALLACFVRMTRNLASLCVAIIDDDESFCRSSSRWLRVAGIQSVIYPSAEEYLSDPIQRRYTCLLVDMQLGGMSGLAMQRKLRAEGDRTPVIFITAHDDPTARTEAMHAGCVAFFRKTDDGARLLEAIRGIAPATEQLNGER
jgi:FixJ family two-component response regulator